jgi:hypothetical protein
LLLENSQICSPIYKAIFESIEKLKNVPRLKDNLPNLLKKDLNLLQIPSTLDELKKTLQINQENSI